MKFLLIGKDVAASKPFEDIASLLIRAGHEADKSNSAYIDGYDAVLTGMSSSENLAADELIAAKWSQEQNPTAPLFLFADNEASVGRPWFAQVRNGVKGIFVDGERSALKASRLFPSTTKIFISGSYAIERSFDLDVSPSDIRKTLSIPDDSIMVLIPGGKDLEINLLHFKGVLKAAEMLSRPIVAVISPHPGDTNDLTYYHNLAKNHTIEIRIVTKDQFSGDQLIAGTKIPGLGIVIPSASTVGRTASCQRVPVVNFFTDQALDRLERSSGSRNWPDVEMGAELQVINDPEKLALVMNDLLLGNITTAPAQEKIYRIPKQKVAEFIANKLIELTMHPVLETEQFPHFEQPQQII